MPFRLTLRPARSTERSSAFLAVPSYGNILWPQIASMTTSSGMSRRGVSICLITASRRASRGVPISTFLLEEHDPIGVGPPPVVGDAPAVGGLGEILLVDDNGPAG